MKIMQSCSKGRTAPVVRSTSCEDILITRKVCESPRICASSFKSTDDLPASVAECFQDTSFVGRIQNSLLLFIGRGSRYKLKSTPGCFLFSLLNLKKRSEKPSETSSTQSEDCQCQSECSPTAKRPVKQINSLPLRVSASNAARKRREPESEPKPVDKNAYKDSYVIKDEGVTYQNEEELLQQYLSLQQLAIARRHCTQLRRIRDSLAGKARPRPNKAFPPTPEQEKLRNFLLDVGFVQYYALLNRHGYDFDTASHMDVLDLAAVGISEPLHRMALKYELDQVRRPIKPVQSIPETVAEWLEGLSLPEYIEHFQQNGIFCPLAAVGLTKRDLQFMGIYMLGHRKKIVLALAAVSMALSCNGYTRQRNPSS